MSTIPTEKPRCEHCRFCSRERPQQNVIQDVLVCRFGPPTPVMIPVSAQQAQLTGLWPIVPPAGWCYHFEKVPLPTIGN